MTDLLATHPHYLFVYGTLKPGHGNNPLIKHYNGQDIGPAKTVRPFLLNDGFPYVWRLPRGTREAYADNLGLIVGHLYKVSDAGLEACDKLEGHPRHYCRTNVTVSFGTPGKLKYATAGIYLAQRDIPHPRDLQRPLDGLLEWGRETSAVARNFQRKRA